MAIAAREGDTIEPEARAGALEILARLAASREPAVADAIEDTFITLAGSGGLQLEWQSGARYAEVEVRPSGQLSWLTAVDDKIGPALAMQRDEFLSAFEAFCGVPAAA